MTTENEVASWMITQFEPNGLLYQEVVVVKIKAEFGKEFTYENESGNDAISKKVLKQFRKLTEGKVVWERGERAWSLLKAGEIYKGRQSE